MRIGIVHILTLASLPAAAAGLWRAIDPPSYRYLADAPVAGWLLDSYRNLILGGWMLLALAALAGALIGLLSRCFTPAPRVLVNIHGDYVLPEATRASLVERGGIIVALRLDAEHLGLAAIPDPDQATPFDLPGHPSPREAEGVIADWFARKVGLQIEALRISIQLDGEAGTARVSWD